MDEMTFNPTRVEIINIIIIFIGIINIASVNSIYFDSETSSRANNIKSLSAIFSGLIGLSVNSSAP